MKKIRIFLLIVMVLVMTASYSASFQVFAEKAETYPSLADNSDITKIVIDDKTVSESLDSYFAERKNEADPGMARSQRLLHDGEYLLAFGVQLEADFGEFDLSKSL